MPGRRIRSQHTDFTYFREKFRSNLSMKDATPDGVQQRRPTYSDILVEYAVEVSSETMKNAGRFRLPTQFE